MEEYEFIGRWVSVSESPPSGNRVLITDGEIVIFGTYVDAHWLLEGISSSVPFNIVAWMPAPKPVGNNTKTKNSD